MELDLISVYLIFRRTHTIRFLQLPHVPGMDKMIPHDIAVHRPPPLYRMIIIRPTTSFFRSFPSTRALTITL